MRRPAQANSTLDPVDFVDEPGGPDTLLTMRKSNQMPVVFIGHGSPMNIIADNAFTDSLKLLAQDIPRPRSILAVSAHWETDSSLVQTHMHPKTIHDFFGFPEELYKTGFKTVGAPELAEKIVSSDSSHFSGSEDWGIDHGTWSVLFHMYPAGDIPTTQLSLNKKMNFSEHYDLGKELQSLRSEGVLILASGNLVHNLKTIQWNVNAPIYDWALEFDELAKKALVNKEFEKFIKPEVLGSEKLFKQAHPSLEHYIPILYALGAAGKNPECQFIFEGHQNASISMRSILFD